MKIFSALLFSTFFFLAHCTSQKSGQANITQGVSGIVTEAMGNQMPSTDKKPVGPMPIATTIFFYQLTNRNQAVATVGELYYTAINTKFIDSTVSNNEGQFALALVPGNYSVFTKVDGKFYANLFDGQNNIHPVTVEANKVTELNITISAKAFY